MNINYINFTKVQRTTYDKVQELEEKMRNAFDPTTFILNDEIVEIRRQLEEQQEKCQHAFVNRKCIICHKENLEDESDSI